MVRRDGGSQDALREELREQIAPAEVVIALAEPVSGAARIC